VRSRVVENLVVVTRSDQKEFGPRPKHLSSRCSLQSRSSQHAYAKVRVKGTRAFVKVIFLCAEFERGTVEQEYGAPTLCIS
jgi:hypothetical protein